MRRTHLSTPAGRTLLLALPLSLLMGFMRQETPGATYASSAMDVWLTAEATHALPEADLSLASDAMDCWLTLDTH